MSCQERVQPSGHFRDRALTQFRTPENIEYLMGAAGGARAAVARAVTDFAAGLGPAFDVLQSDPYVDRAPELGQTRAVEMWGEVRRLNREFLKTSAGRASAPTALPRGAGDDSYQMQMFTADSLRPAGLDRLNAAGPLYAVLEDQSREAQRAARRRDPYLYGDDAAPEPSPACSRTGAWRGGSNTDLMEAHFEAEGEDDWDTQESRTRFMRYDAVPFWQKGGREGTDLDIDETLGVAPVELDGMSRGWDMPRQRARGEKRRVFGPRNTY